jgi:SAM-dependent methyltransferase
VELADLDALLGAEGQALLAGLPPYDEGTTLAVARRLRAAGHDPRLVATALTQARLRARALGRLGERAGRMYFTPDGLEQASRATVAAHRARRYEGAAGAEGLVADLCCGIGSDLAALASAAGGRVLGVDRDPVTAAVAGANVTALQVDHVEVQCADVTGLALDGVTAAFVDPSRRGDGRRRFDPAAYSPPFDFVTELAARVPATGAKVAPGIPHAALPLAAEAEWVSERGDVLECALWFGPLAQPGVRRRATLLPSGATLVGDTARPVPTGPVRRYLLEPDGAVIRAGLVAEVAALTGGSLLDPTIAYIAADDPAGTPFARCYEVRDTLPFQLKRLRALLRARGVGRLTIKKRGTAVEPSELRHRLDLSGDREATLVLTRVAGRQTALLVDPVPPVAQRSTSTT